MGYWILRICCRRAYSYSFSNSCNSSSDKDHTGTQGAVNKTTLYILKTKNMGNTSNTGKVIGAIFLGAAIGGALGILFAPDKGSETRKKISKKGNDLTDAVKEKFDAIVDKFKKEVEDVKDQATDFAENGRSVIEKLKTS